MSEVAKLREEIKHLELRRKEIERMLTEKCEHEWRWYPVAGEGQICQKCHARNFDCDD